eukprot:SAG31_NODE_1084_length_10007_cov_4.353452_3_plen_99_part_00
MRATTCFPRVSAVTRYGVTNLIANPNDSHDPLAEMTGVAPSVEHILHLAAQHRYRSALSLGLAGAHTWSTQGFVLPRSDQRHRVSCGSSPVAQTAGLH